ncbi:DNA-3-methyladenine glycosylase [Aridibaculum aurantiacum]|uniref:DNA-3-methyladenine glycosylase n=1 Tax=Aridibaculum aurantiacum TaxID=2810307 RepID=UPI001A966C74|nr:DNA-3-methyladenine glycosylase [Aridibaculum aurantiacum]
MFVASPSNIAASFNRIANDLFNNYIIQVNDNFYRLLEIEFYYNDSKEHNDSYTHGHKLQKRSGYWYVHGSGIDIAIGNEQAYGGILLRSIQKLQPATANTKEQYNFGPQNVLTELISGFNSCIDGAPNVFALVKPEEHGITIEPVPEEEIIQCGRIGLSAKDEQYRDSLYRYLIHPHLPHKEKTKMAELLYKKWSAKEDRLDKIKELLGSEFLKKYR